MMIPRRTNSAIAHNKFLILLQHGIPQAVWTGSTNITWGGLFGQSNVGHLVRDPALAARYLDYWTALADRPRLRHDPSRQHQPHPDPASPPPAGITPVFSPRTTLDLIDWYAQQAGKAKKSFFMTAAFGVHEKIAAAIAPPSDVLRYLVLEKAPGAGGGRFDVDRNVKIAVGSFLRSGVLDRWTKEQLTGLNRNVLYSHTKYLLVDPLSDNPLVVIRLGQFQRPLRPGQRREHARHPRRHPGRRHLPRRIHARLQPLLLPLPPTAHRNGRRNTAHLAPDDSWVERYYDRSTPSHRQRLLFR